MKSIIFLKATRMIYTRFTFDQSNVLKVRPLSFYVLFIYLFNIRFQTYPGIFQSFLLGHHYPLESTFSVNKYCQPLTMGQRLKK